MQVKRLGLSLDHIQVVNLMCMPELSHEHMHQQVLMP